jgi:hypothetical protein
MYARLAFAVAAHLEPEILVVDEVLAVGDVEFQKKCLGRMRHVAGEGRTVLFVSHNLAAVRALCTRSLLLADGRVVSDDSIDAVIKRYANASSSAHSISFARNEARPSISAIVVDQTALIERDLIVDISFVSPRPLHTAVGGIVLRADTGEPVWGSNSRFHPSTDPVKGLTLGVLRCEARRLPIRSGQYHLSAWFADWHEELDARVDALSIHIGENDGDRLRPPASALGHVDWPAVWSSGKARPNLLPQCQAFRPLNSRGSEIVAFRLEVHQGHHRIVRMPKHVRRLGAVDLDRRAGDRLASLDHAAKALESFQSGVLEVDVRAVGKKHRTSPSMVCLDFALLGQ